MERSAIDIHQHYVPPGLIAEMRRSGKVIGVEVGETAEGRPTFTFAGGRPFVVIPGLVDVERRLEMMDKGSIALAALEPHTACLGYPLDGAGGETWCRLYNEGLVELVRKHPDRFVALAAVPLQDPARAARVLDDAMEKLTCRGGYIATNVNGAYFNSEAFDPFWKKAEALDALVVMHPEDVAGAERMGPYGMLQICGNPADTALSLGFLTYSGVFDRFPNLKLCSLHGGGFFPYHLGRFDRGHGVRMGPRRAAASLAPSDYLRRNLYFDALVYRADTLDYLRRLAGSDRLMVGTDYPYPLGDWLAVDKVLALDCSETEKRKILVGNARRLLKL